MTTITQEQKQRVAEAILAIPDDVLLTPVERTDKEMGFPSFGVTHRLANILPVHTSVVQQIVREWQASAEGTKSRVDMDEPQRMFQLRERSQCHA